jgi:hypothetical protein
VRIVNRGLRHVVALHFPTHAFGSRRAGLLDEAIG